MTATLVIIDRSLSMPMNDFFFHARTRAIELVEHLSRTDSPDQLHGVLAFATTTTAIDPSDLPDLEWDHEYGSNLAHVLRVATTSFNGRAGKVLLLSDLFASAFTDQNDKVVFSSPPSQETLDLTTHAINACRSAAIQIHARRYYCQDIAHPYQSQTIRDAILQTGGTVEDFPIEPPPRVGSARLRNGASLYSA